MSNTVSEGDLSLNILMQHALEHGFGDLHFKVDPASGMIAIIAIHSTKLGPALGGCRFIQYPTVSAAVLDAMRLARGMSYKAALVNLPLGGGKSVIIKPAADFDRTAYLRRFGQFVNELGGRYITAVDSGTELVDMDIIAKQTPYVASLSAHKDNPSPFTAKGVLRGIQAAVAFKLGKNSLAGVRVAIQGLGHVGSVLAEHLYQAGAKLLVADVNAEQVAKAVAHFGAEACSIDAIHRAEVDVFAPCALGAVINDQSLPELRCQIIAGAANNQLAHAYHGQLLHDKGILYATDYVINSGGLIFAASRYLHSHEELVEQQIDSIAASLTAIFEGSAQQNIPCNAISDQMAQERIR